MTHFIPSAGRHRPSEFSRIVLPVFGTVCEALAFVWGLVVVSTILVVAAGFCA